MRSFVRRGSGGKRVTNRSRGCVVGEKSRPQGTLDRLAVSKQEAADALGVSIDFLEQHVMHELRVVRRGRRRLIPVPELERWLSSNAARSLG